MCREEKESDLSDDVKKLKAWLPKIAREAEFLGLQSMTRQARRIFNSADQWNATEIDSALEELERRFDEETEALKLFYISSDRLAFYNKTDLF
jgi:hypothetical protein